MDGVVDPLTKVAPTQTRSGFAIYFEEDPSIGAADTKVSFQHNTSRRRTSSGNAYYAILFMVGAAALVLGFFTGVLDIDKMSAAAPHIDNKWFNDLLSTARRPEYLPIINAALMIFTLVMSLFNFGFLIFQKFIGAISALQTWAFSILTLSTPTCMFVIGIWAATI